MAKHYGRTQHFGIGELHPDGGTFLFTFRYGSEQGVVRAHDSDHARDLAAVELVVDRAQVTIEPLEEAGEPGIIAYGDAGS